jgi:hypothetical protein
MTGKYSTTTDINFLHANFPVVKMDGHDLLVALDMREGTSIHSNELIRRVFMESIDINAVNMHEKPWDIILQQNEEINLMYPRIQKGT